MSNPQKRSPAAASLGKSTLLVVGGLLAAFGLLVLAHGLYLPSAIFITPGAALCWFFRPRRRREPAEERTAARPDGA